MKVLRMSIQEGLTPCFLRIKFRDDFFNFFLLLNELSVDTSHKTNSTLKEIQSQHESMEDILKRLKHIEWQTKNLKDFVS